MTTLRLEAVNTITEIEKAQADAGGQTIQMQYGDFWYDSDKHCVFESNDGTKYKPNMVLKRVCVGGERFFIIRHVVENGDNTLVFAELQAPVKVISGDCIMSVSTDGVNFQTLSEGAIAGAISGDSDKSLKLDERRNELLERIAVALEYPTAPEVKLPE